MADSRRASERLLHHAQRKAAIQGRIIFFLLSLIVAFLATYFLRDTSFTIAQDYVLFILFFSICLWITEAIPPFAVGIMIVGFLVFFLGNPDIEGPEGAINVQKFVNTWSNSVIWLILGGFFIAEAISKVGLDTQMFRFAVRSFGSKPKRLLLGLMLATAVGSMIMSNTATTAMMIAAVAPLVATLEEDAPFLKALFLGIPAAAALGGMGTIIGSPPNAIAVEAINSIPSLDVNFGFLDWMIYGVPIALVLTLIVWFGLTKKYVPKVSALNINVLDLGNNSDEEDKSRREIKLRKNIVLAVVGLTILLWMTEKWHGIPAAAVSGIPIIIFTMVSIITGDDVRKLPWDTLMLVAGGLSLGLAIQEAGLASYFVGKLENVSLPLLVLIGLFSITTVALSNVMSNTATATILIPAASLLAVKDPLLLPVIIGLSASCALLFPVSTPPNAVVFASGKIKQSDFQTSGLLAGLAGPVVIILWVLLLAALF